MKATRACSVNGCDRPVLARGWCSVHYDRWRHNGDPGPAELLRQHYSGQCKIDDCDKPPHARGWCRKHHERWRRHGSPTIVLQREYVLAVKVKYSSLHSRLHRSLGRAADHACDHCGGKAAQWAYDHNDPNELIGDQGCPYSMDPTHYIPLCVSCHITFDRSTAKE